MLHKLSHRKLTSAEGFWAFITNYCIIFVALLSSRLEIKSTSRNEVNPVYEKQNLDSFSEFQMLHEKFDLDPGSEVDCISSLEDNNATNMIQ
jgi:hypothetical protein